MRRRRILLLITLAACGSRECRLDPSPSCSYRPERGVSDASVQTFADEVVSVEAGDQHACALLSTGDDVFGGARTRVRCWGGNTNDQLARRASPAAGELWWYGHWGRPQLFEVGAAHACTLRTDTDPDLDISSSLARCWGNNDGGQLGLDPEETIEGIVEEDFYGLSLELTSLALGGLHGCTGYDIGVLCVGDNRWGQLGTVDGECCEPNIVDGSGWGWVENERFELAAGTRHTCAISMEASGLGPLLCWGHSAFGQVGPASEPPDISPVPDPVLPSVRALAAGPHHTCAIDEAGSLHCFGRNERGELGLGDTTNRTEPTVVPLEVEPSAIFAGGESGLDFGGDLDVVTPGAAHSCVLDEDGLAFCWGDNSSGQLGLSPGAPELEPVATHPDLRFRSLALGGRFTCGTTSSEEVLCWGDNTFGQLGRPGESSHEPTPVPIFEETFASP